MGARQRWWHRAVPRHAWHQHASHPRRERSDEREGGRAMRAALASRRPMRARHQADPRLQRLERRSERIAAMAGISEEPLDLDNKSNKSKRRFRLKRFGEIRPVTKPNYLIK